MSGNIPKISSYGVFTSQVLRYAIACQEYQDFKTRSAMLVKKLLRQNYEIVYLKRFLKSSCQNTLELFLKNMGTCAKQLYKIYLENKCSFNNLLGLLSNSIFQQYIPTVGSPMIWSADLICTHCGWVFSIVLCIPTWGYTEHFNFRIFCFRQQFYLGVFLVVYFIQIQ